MDGNSVALLGELLTYAGHQERGMQLADQAKRLNPNQPGGFWYADFYSAFSQGDYRGALGFALKSKLHGNPLAPMFIAAACGQLGEGEAGAKAVSDLLKFRPELPAVMRKQVAKVWNPEYGERFLEGLRKAGMEIPEVGAAAIPKASTSPASSREKSYSGATRAQEGFWVAVLPFKYKGTDPNLDSLAEGLVEGIITGFSRFSYMQVISRGSSARYASESADVRKIGKELGARYVMEGNLRQADTRLRITVQLLDSSTGAHLWAETYDRVFQPNAIFDFQDELVPKIVSTVADPQGVLLRNMGEFLRSRKTADLTPYEAVLRSFAYLQRISAEEHRLAREALEVAVELAPDYATAWAMLSIMFREEYCQGFNPGPTPLERADTAARRAIEIAPSDNLGFHALASVQFLRREFSAFRTFAERAVALNPMDGFTLAYVGLMLAYAGDWERGCALSRQARSLNPHHPGWFWFADAFDAFRQGNYREALAVIAKANMPGFWRTHLALAASYGHLGELDAAQSAVHALLSVKPNFAAIARAECFKWWQPTVVDQILDGLRKAGLELPTDEPGASASRVTPDPGAPASAGASIAVPDSGATRAGEGFWVAVLPFKNTGSNADLTALADGLTDDIITGLSRFSYLRVIARSSTARYAQQAVDVRTVAQELGARYVMEGSIRQAGAKIRIAVHLVDAGSGAGLWAETYDRPFTPEATLDLLDDVVPRIVSTVADTQGVLPHSMTDALRNRAPESLTPYEAVLRSFGYHQLVSEEEHLAARTALENAVKQPPDRADCWAMLSWLYRSEYTHGFNLRPDPLGRALGAARRAIELEPSNQLAHAALASALFCRREFDAFRAAAERALTLNRMEGYATAYLGLQIAFDGDWEGGCALVERATQLNPHHPGWYWLPLSINAYRQFDGRRALEFALKTNMPGLWTTQLALTLIYSQLGETARARATFRDLLAMRPSFRTSAREDLGKWWQPDMVERMLADLCQAGLEIGSSEASESASSSSAAFAAPSIAVLPFANLSADPEQDYFSDGLAEEIINLLAQVPGLKVIARTSAFAFRGKEQDVRGIAEALGVGTILEGSVRRSGSRIRVRAQLINAADGSHLWSERYDRELSDIFAVQDEISAAIARALRVKFSRDAAPERYTPKLAAYEAYLKARYLQAKVTPESLELARRCYEQASELDPAFGMAHAGLGYYWLSLAHFGRHSAHECVLASRAEVQRALQIDPSLPDAHASLGLSGGNV